MGKTSVREGCLKKTAQSEASDGDDDRERGRMSKI